MGDHIPEWAVEPKHSRSRLQLMSQPSEDSDSVAESWPLHKAAYLLGRNGQAVDICIAHKSASRVHACLAHDDAGDLYLIDLGSAHGTYLNGDRMEKHGKARLVSGDKVIFAACSTAYVVATPDAASGAVNDAERDGYANGTAAHPGSVPSDRSDRQAAGRDDRGDQGRPANEAQTEPSKRDSDSRNVRSHKHHSRSSERAEAQHDERQRNGHRARRSPTDRRTGPADHSRIENGPRRQHAPPGHGRHRSPIPQRPSPVPSRPQKTSTERRRRSVSPVGKRKHRRSRSRSPARHRKRERDDCMAAQKQRERQAAFKEPPAPAPAPVPAGDPIDIVRAMMGVPAGGSGFAVEQKKKLLWGFKKAEAPVQGTVAGHNRWDTAEFTTDADKDKFQRLMGVKRTEDGPSASGSADGALFDRHVPQREQQQRLEGDLERSFLEGVRRGTRGAMGLGL